VNLIRPFSKSVLFEVIQFTNPRTRLFRKGIRKVTADDRIKTILISKKITEIGLEIKILKFPLDIIRDCRKDSSNIGPG